MSRWGTSQTATSSLRRILLAFGYCLTPPASDVLDTANRRLAVCKTIKKLERSGKSSVIDSLRALGCQRARTERVIPFTTQYAGSSFQSRSWV